MSAAVTTKTGDTGTTGSLACRMSKGSLKAQTLSRMDETASTIVAVLRAYPREKQTLKAVYKTIYLCNTIIASFKDPELAHDDVVNVEKVLECEHVIGGAPKYLEGVCDILKAHIVIPFAFIIPQSPEIDAARTSVRATEVFIVGLNSALLTKCVVPFLNRLSDYLYVLEMYHGAEDHEQIQYANVISELSTMFDV